ncbi:neural cell adhesion molecule 1-like isoform X2 [Bolinopsis microptera]|uniref:neural cell adhesion molecule 1-like isoform X2 n=1 Tax=Bolinopsis microptera TaxID=2820187 RepID=UPI003078EF7F
MFLLWLVVGFAELALAVKLKCGDTAADICSVGEKCSVSCEESCPVFVGEDVSICGWLQSLGYDTTDLHAEPLQYNLNIRSNTPERSKRSTSISSHAFPYIPFKFIRQPQSQMESLGSTVKFYCHAEGNSSLKYEWYKSYVSKFSVTPWIPSKLPGSSNNEYVITETTREDSGYYICVVTEEGLSGDKYWSQPAKLELLYLEKPAVVVQERTFRSGLSMAKLNCDLPNSYPQAIATWYKYELEGGLKEVFGMVDKFYYPEDGYLFLINLNRGSHEGTYECHVNNSYLNEHTVVKRVVVSITGTASPNQRPPTKAFFNEGAARTAIVGGKLVLRCAAYGNPIPKVYWAFGDDVDTLCRIPSSRYNSSDEGRVVELHKVKDQDTDYRYECKAESGNNPTKTIGYLKDVGVYRKLEITQEKLEYIPLYHSNITLSCPVTGQKRNFWYKNGIRLTSDSEDDYTLNSTANSLVIPTSTRTHGVYTCLSLSEYGGLVLKNLHMTIPVQELSVHIARDISDKISSNSVETSTTVRNSTLVTCTASGFPPPRLYWYENQKLVTDSSRYSFSFNKSNVTVINTTLNVSRSQREERGALNIDCVAVSQTEGYLKEKSARLVLDGEGDTGRVEKVEDRKIMYIIIGASCFVVLLLVSLSLVLGVKFKKERRNTRPIRTYIKDIQSIQRDGGGEVSTKSDLREEYKYAAHLHDILKTMKIKDEGDIESFRDIIGDWVNEEMQGNDDSDFARRFRDSFISKRSMGNRLNSSNRFGNQFKLDLRNNERKPDESNLLDETPERYSVIPLGRRSPRSPRRASNPIYSALPDTNSDNDLGDTEIDASLRHTAL